MLHWLRSVLVRPGRDRSAGAVEVNETELRDGDEGLVTSEWVGGAGQSVLSLRNVNGQVVFPAFQFDCGGT